MTQAGLKRAEEMGEAQPRTVRRPCPICQTEPTQADIAQALHVAEGIWSLIKCPSCDFIFLPDIPPPATFSVELAWEKSHGTEDAKRKKRQPIFFWIDTHTRWRLNLLPRIQPVDVLNKSDLSGPVIDLGCGSGGFTKTLAQRFTPYGVEISQYLANQADTKFQERGGHCHHGPAATGLDAFPDGFFAGALLRSYLEHDAEAREVLFALHRKIRPGGLAVVRVPNYGSLNRYVMGQNWCGFRFPDHCNYFTRSSLVELAQQAGFRVHFPPLFNLPTDDNMLAVLRA